MNFRFALILLVTASCAKKSEAPPAGGGGADFDSTLYYTKAEVDAKLGLLPTSATTYTMTQIDEKLSLLATTADVNTKVANKGFAYNTTATTAGTLDGCPTSATIASSVPAGVRGALVSIIVTTGDGEAVPGFYDVNIGKFGTSNYFSCTPVWVGKANTSVQSTCFVPLLDSTGPNDWPGSLQAWNTDFDSTDGAFRNRFTDNSAPTATTVAVSVLFWLK